MEQQLLKYLKIEAKIIDELIELAEYQQKMLIEFKLYQITDITEMQDRATDELQKATYERISYTAKMLEMTFNEGKNLKLSEIAKEFDLNQNAEEIKLFFKQKIEKLQEVNSMNRLLANRAKHSVSDMISYLVTEDKQMCNVQV